MSELSVGYGQVVLLLFADDDLKREFVPRLTATSLDELAQGAQFLTEKDGGSDVGVTGTIARREDGAWRLWLLLLLGVLAASWYFIWKPEYRRARVPA